MSTFLSRNGLEEIAVGGILGLQTILPIFLSIPFGFIGDRVGHKKMITFGSVGMFLGAGLCYLTSQTLWLIVPAQLISGVAQMTVWISAQALILEIGTSCPDRKIAQFSTLTALGQAAGPLMAGFLVDFYGYSFDFFANALMSLIMLGCAMLLSSKRSAEKNGAAPGHSLRQELRSILVNSYWQGIELARKRDVFYTLVFTFLLAFTLNQRTSFYPIYLHESGWGVSMIGILISIGSISAILVRFICPLLLARMSAWTLMQVCNVVSIAGMFLTPLFDSFYVLAVVSCFTGLALGLNQPLSLQLIYQFTDSQQYGLSIGIRMICNRLAQFVNPLSFALFSHVVGMGIAFYLTGALLISVLLFANHRLSIRPIANIKPKRGIFHG